MTQRRYGSKQAAAWVLLLALSLLIPRAACADSLSGGTAKYYHDGSHGTLNLGGGTVWVLTWWDLDLTSFTGALNLVYGDDGSGSGWENFPIQIHSHFYGAGGHLLQAYDKWWGGPISSHGLNPGDGTNPFDVRVYLHQNPDNTWHIEPYLRLDGGSWTPFWGGAFDSADAFDLTASTLMVQFDPSGSGTVYYEPPTASLNIVCDPDPLILNVASLPNTPDGQIAVKYLGGGGGLLYGYSVTVTWDDSVVDLTGVTQGNLLSDAGTTQLFVYPATGNTRTIDCTLLGAVDGVTGPGTMFTMGFNADSFGTSAVDITLLAFRDKDNNPLTGFSEDDGEIQVDITNPSVTGVAIENLTLAHTHEYAKNTDYLKLTATVTDDYALTAGDIKANLSTLLTTGGSAAVAEDYTSNVATWTVALENVVLTADGLKTVTVTATDGLGNVGTGDDDITVDNTPPGKVTGFAAAPAHEEGLLSWDDPTLPSLDTNYYGIVVRYTAWGDYPYYDPPIPVYPADHTAGDGEAFNDLGAVTGGVHAIVPRDIHYYSAFAYDWALNYGGVDAGGQDRCTNYWLGDVAGPMGHWGSEPTYDYNGLVNDADFDKLGGTYAASSPVIPDAECDVGPTDDHSRVGVPEPDDFIGFEDLMIFSMNYGVVAPRVVPFLPDESSKALSLELAELGAGDGVLEVALRLEGNASEVKGLSTILAYDSAELEFVSARLSDDMSSPLAPVFFWHGTDDESVQIDLAVLGTDVTVGGSGEVAVLTFRALGDAYTVGFESATVRSGDNEDLVASFEGIEAKPEVPMAFRLVGNLPNPFNPVTKIAYDVPHEAAVAIRIYDVSGRLVRTLVVQRMEPGRHEAVWNGRNETGEPVGSGVYFCTMDADEFHGSHKMMLLK